MNLKDQQHRLNNWEWSKREKWGSIHLICKYLTQTFRWIIRIYSLINLTEQIISMRIKLSFKWSFIIKCNSRCIQFYNSSNQSKQCSSNVLQTWQWVNSQNSRSKTAPQTKTNRRMSAKCQQWRICRPWLALPRLVALTLRMCSQTATLTGCLL